MERPPGLTKSDTAFPTEVRFAHYHPYFRNVAFSYAESLLGALRYKNTIVPKVAPVISVLSLWAAFVVVVHNMGLKLAMDDKLIAILGVSLAMLLAFRINRGFERYWQGAQLWTALSIQIRTLSRLLWNGVRTPSPEAYQEKLQIMKLLLAVAIATKYALRGENALEQQELIRLLPHGYGSQSYRSSLVDFGPEANAALNEERTSEQATGGSTGGATSGSRDGYEGKDIGLRTHPPLVLLRHRSSYSKGSAISSVAPSPPPYSRPYPVYRRPFGPQPETNVLVINAPLDIIHRISAYVRRQRQQSTVDLEDTPSISNAINAMIDAVSKFEQILYIPMPKSYDIHLKQILLVYFLALPFQLVRQLGWLLIPVTIITSLAFFGADAIGTVRPICDGTSQYC
ncbi:hypothetical protein, variant [Spizellomyces punctatus DAOM BR117]|uniref:Uncharacterized protein n=1 Tax=Spizellomyces punctatus (strain DAOM BR117) TaxID=645134 RepID=A0A0L0HUN2_SPIPD|nr:hypothetical protein, variant [Spizellomyces punctatus DAOM BR117]KND04838.1 hypothetical protein, variant [Spizellomyces punctatus DAOM BR117]|eukprot:XP_016612877.1 hypothetical protein, variant [Spizellomyces punctatus DAOM BR117]